MTNQENYNQQKIIIEHNLKIENEELQRQLILFQSQLKEDTSSNKEKLKTFEHKLQQAESIIQDKTSQLQKLQTKQVIDDETIEDLNKMLEDSQKVNFFFLSHNNNQ